MRSVAINVGANTNEPGFRGPLFPSGAFEFVPIPETEPTHASASVPTYGDLAPHLSVEIPRDLRDAPVHLDPEFPEYPFGERYTYGDPYGVKARPLLDLAAGDYVFFYATLSATATAGDLPPWQAPDWGAYVVGHFRLGADPLAGEAYRAADEATRAPFANNAHVKRETFDAAVLLRGDDRGSELYDAAVPLSGREAGVDANRLVTELSNDSGKGPWWRRPLRFDEAGTAELLRVHDERDLAACFRDR